MPCFDDDTSTCFGELGRKRTTLFKSENMFHEFFIFYFYFYTVVLLHTDSLMAAFCKLVPSEETGPQKSIIIIIIIIITGNFYSALAASG